MILFYRMQDNIIIDNDKINLSIGSLNCIVGNNEKFT